MKTIIISFLFMTSLLISCNKSETVSNAGNFTITSTAGKVYTTTYVNLPIPSQNGTFGFQYNKNISGTLTLYSYLFSVLIDNSNDSFLDLSFPSLPQVGITYTSNSALNRIVSFGVHLSNSNLAISKSDLVFTSFSYLGYIAGTVKGYNSQGALLVTANFDFIAQ